MTNDSDHFPFHPGEYEAQVRFNSGWDEGKARRLGRIIGCSLDDEKAMFIELLPFFFLATADAAGNCDCSFKGTEPETEGRSLPVVHVVDPKRLWFPDYSGNRMYNSLGNILQNPHVGLLFIDFASQTRLRVNGRARILEQRDGWKNHWPAAMRAAEVSVDQVYCNCSKRIPKRP
ncbi:MAG: pyridoxamine 5'-phosphate oxidase family protein [Pseudomonadota bacterium]